MVIIFRVICDEAHPYSHYLITLHMLCPNLTSLLSSECNGSIVTDKRSLYLPSVLHQVKSIISTFIVYALIKSPMIKFKDSH